MYSAGPLSSLFCGNACATSESGNPHHDSHGEGSRFSCSDLLIGAFSWLAWVGPAVAGSERLFCPA
eukprot:9653264-Alexandrium_andersonii.AAC.1